MTMLPFARSLRTALLLSAVAFASLAAVSFGACSRASAQAAGSDTLDLRVARDDLDVGDRLRLSPPMQRALRTARTGGVLFGAGVVGTFASAVLWASPFRTECASDDPLCLREIPRGMGAFSGLVVSSAMVTAGLVTLGVGIARRNRLDRLDAVAIGVGPGGVDLALRF